MNDNEWVVRWGEGDPERWLQAELGVKAGDYRMSHTPEKLMLDDPKETRTRSLDIYHLREGFGRSFDIAMTELSNGIWVVAHRRSGG